MPGRRAGPAQGQGPVMHRLQQPIVEQDGSTPRCTFFRHDLHARGFEAPVDPSIRFLPPLGPTILDHHIVAFGVSRFFQTLAECRHVAREGCRRPTADEPDDRHGPLLCTRYEGPDRCPAKSSDDIAPPHAITSSARAIKARPPVRRRLRVPAPIATRFEGLMWTPATRRQHSRTGLRYETDVTDAEWALIEPLLPPPPKRVLSGLAPRPLADAGSVGYRAASHRGADEDAVLGMRIGSRDRATRAHRPGLSPVPLSGVRQAVQRALWHRAEPHPVSVRCHCPRGALALALQAGPARSARDVRRARHRVQL